MCIKFNYSQKYGDTFAYSYTRSTLYQMIVPLITTALSLGAQAFGANQSAQANNKADSYLQSRLNSLESDYASDYYKNFLDTEAARSTMNRLQSQYAEMAKNIKGSSAAGSTAEAEIAEKDNIQKRYADAVSNLAGMGTQYKDNIRARYLANKANLQNQQFGLLQQKAQKWDNFGQNVGSATSGILNAWGMGAFGGNDMSDIGANALKGV